MSPKSCLIRVFAACLLASLANQRAPARDAADSGRSIAGKSIELIVGGAAGSDADLYGRLVAKYFGRSFAGNPAVTVADMPGGDGQRAAAYIYSSPATNGTVIGVVPAGALTAPLWLGLRHQDSRKFVYLGSAASARSDCFVGDDAPVQSLRDAFAKEVTMGALDDGGPTRDGPLLLDALLGTRFRVVPKFASVGDLLKAIREGQVMGACGLTWSGVSTRHPEWLPKGVLRGVVQESVVSGSALATRLGIPLASDFAASAEDREVLSLAYDQQAFAQPFILPPRTPPAIAEALRKAFVATLQDHSLLAAAKAASLKIDPLSGQDVARKVAALYAAPAQAVGRVRMLLSGVRTQ